MAGLDKIVNQILEEANNSAGEKIQKAKQEAEAILQKAKEESAKETEKIAAKAVADVKNYEDRVKSSADLSRRTKILETKQEMIAAVLDKAYETFCQKSDAEYFETIKAMLNKFVLAEDGEVIFSVKDLERMPAGFAEEIQKIAAAKGGTLALSKESRQIEGGFVLVYGGIEENCTFRALFDSQKDELQDKVQKILFL